MTTYIKPYNVLLDSDKKLIITEYYKGKSFQDISRTLSVSQRAVARVLKEANINTRLKNRYTLNEDYFEKIDEEGKAYWLGFIYADGYVGDEKINNIVLSSIDKGHLIKFKNEISYSGEVRHVKRKGGFQREAQSHTINFSSVKMSNDLRKLGLYPGKSTTMNHLPNIPKELISHFIRGYFDGDGSIGCYINPTTIKGKTYTYEKPSMTMIGTYNFLKDMQKYLPYKVFYEHSRSEYMYYLRSSGKKPVYKIMSYIYNNATIFLERKYNKWMEIAPICRDAIRKNSEYAGNSLQLVLPV